MVKHTVIKNNTIINEKDLILINGKWEKVKQIKNDHIVFNNFIVCKDSLIPSWDVEIRTDFSDSEVEYEIALVQVQKDGARSNSNEPNFSKIILFNEKNNIYPTKHNLDHMKKVADMIKIYFNKEGISFEENNEGRCHEQED